MHLFTALAQQVTKILRTNVRVCDAAGPLYSTQLTAFFMDMLNVYKCYSEHISLAVARQVRELHTLYSKPSIQLVHGHRCGVCLLYIAESSIA
jgi:hypothetical protein